MLPHLARGFGLVWTAAHGWTVGWVALLLVQGLLPVATVYLTRAVVNNLAEGMGAASPGLAMRDVWASARPTLFFVALLAGIAVLSEILRGITGWIRTAQAELVKDHISGLIHAKANSLDLAFYETPEYYDRLFRARTDAAYRPVALLENTGSLAQNGLTLVAMAGVLVPYGIWLPLALFISTLPAFSVVLRYTLRQHQWRLRNTAAERRAQYYDWLQTSQEAAAELRLFALGEYFRAGFQKLRRRLRGERIELARDQAMAELVAGSLGLTTMGLAVAWMVWKAARGLATLGDVALLYQAFNQGQRLMRTLLENIGQIYGNSLFLENLFEFLDIQPQLADAPRPSTFPAKLERGVCFEGVTFRYPGSARPALDTFDLTVAANEIVAIVGANGAGKSTLIKLLCRLYDPDAGRVLIDGRDLREFSLAELRRRITVLFQEPVHHQDTAAQNIAFGDLAMGATPTRIEEAARAAGADGPISRLPNGYETLLGKRFGGAELSVGEWQRIALARAFLRQAPIILLDEPTSAMDSWAEADWLARFRTLAAGRTAIVITHRFTTAMQADVIHVMESGRIVESGTHHGLLALQGHYARSWATQMKTRTAAAS